VGKKENIRRAFQIADCLDNARWFQESRAPRLVNYNMDPDAIPNETDRAEYIILSHWLTYICDRQMQYEQIWNKGGCVFSWLVMKYQACDMEGLRELLAGQGIVFYEKDGERKCGSAAHAGECSPAALERARFKDGQPMFSPRFPAFEGISIVNTLVTLKKHGGLGGYLKAVANSGAFQENRQDAMKILLFAMHKLSYENVLTNELERKLGKVDVFSGGRVALDLAGYREFSRSKIFESKRVNCAVRDYFKRAEYVEHFERLIGGENFKHLLTQLWQIELPGDVWNNNTEFGKCLRKLGISHGKDKLNRALRKAYEEAVAGRQIAGYPEQFDVTFDFALCMCEGKEKRGDKKGTPKCDICLFALLCGKEGFDVRKFEECCNTGSGSCGLLKAYCRYDVPCSRDGNTCLKARLRG